MLEAVHRPDLYDSDDRLYVNGSATPAAGAVNTVIATTPALPKIGKVGRIDNIIASCNQACIGQIMIDPSTDGRCPGFVSQHIFTPSVPVIIPVKHLFRGFQLQSGVVVFRVRHMLSTTPGTDVITAALTVTGWSITDDLNYSAKKVALFIGDSILNGTGPTKTAKMWAFLARNYLRSLDHDIRTVLKSAPGATTSDWAAWIDGEYASVERANVIFYSVGVNDAIAAAADATYTANLLAFWNWAKVRYPDTPVIITTPTPLENNTQETKAVALRAAAIAFVAAQNSPRLKCIDFGSVFDRTVSANYAATDTPGSRVHPVDAGHKPLISGGTSLLNGDWSVGFIYPIFYRNQFAVCLFAYRVGYVGALECGSEFSTGEIRNEIALPNISFI